MQVKDRGDFIAISIHDLEPETCVEIKNNLHSEKKFGKKISVFPLVDNSPTKQDGDKLEADLDISSESDSDEESEVAAIEVDDNFKRKANESPESKDGFQTVPGKKGKNIKKNKLN